MPAARRGRCSTLAAPILLVGLLAALAPVDPSRDACAAPVSLADAMTADAELHGLDFVDGRHGWAVGDRGVLLRTTDGGRQWTRLASPVDCSLYAVSFLDHRRGWAVGGTNTPYANSSRGVVLTTNDGGETWRRLPADTLPLLRHVAFFDARTGVAVGGRTPFAPSGVFQTRDGGETWQPAPTAEPWGATAAWFSTPSAGLLGGPRGCVAALTNQGLRANAAPVDETRAVRDLLLSGSSEGWLVGDGGLVQTTADRGATWRSPPTQPTQPTPPTTRPPTDTADWRSVATVGANVWIAGSPGSVVLHSPNAGRTWRRQTTGVTAPLSFLTFVDERRGWAAGALGTIVATTDGGQTWRVQRRGGKRTALAVFVANAADTPLELLASLGAAQGCLASVDCVFAPADSQAVEQRLREAVVASGGTTASVWDLSPPTHPLPQSRATMVELQRRLITRLRTLRPDLVVIARGSLDAPTPADSLLEEAMRKAAAGDAAVRSELAEIGLATHAVQCVIVSAPARGQASPRLVTGDFESLLGTSPAQWVGARRGLIAKRYEPAPDAFTWRVLDDRGMNAAGGRGPLAGVAVARGGGARRPVAPPPSGGLAALRDAAQKQGRMPSLLSASAGGPDWRASVLGLTAGLQPDTGAELLYQLADGYRRDGKLRLAADTFYLLARRYTDHPLCESALVWLLRYYASSEVAVAESLRRAERKATGSPLANVPSAAPPLSPASTSGPLSREERAERARQLGDYFEKAAPARFADPALRFPIAAAHRAADHTDEAEATLVVLANRALDAGWKRAAAAERWLLANANADPSTRRRPAPKPVARCERIDRRPQLDGRFDEPFWQAADAIPVGGGEVRLARDADYLYIAIDCPKLAGLAYPERGGPRRRDADLSRADRVTLCLDTDRDYTSCFTLAVDARGRTADRCWGGQPWDPAWYVASEQTADRWRAEAAAPLAALAGHSPLPPGACWAMGLVRQTPNGPAECWASEYGADEYGADNEATEESPDRFGLLLLP